jgi:VanZ family protein
VKRKIPVATIAIVAIILLALLLPASSLPDGPGVPGLDKLVHALLFLALAVAMRAELGLGDGRSVGLAIVAALAVAAATEALQLAVDGRSADPYDAAADMAGFVVGLMLSRPLSAIALGFSAMVRRASRLASRRRRY